MKNDSAKNYIFKYKKRTDKRPQTLIRSLCTPLVRHLRKADSGAFVKKLKGEYNQCFLLLFL